MPTIETVAPTPPQIREEVNQNEKQADHNHRPAISDFDDSSSDGKTHRTAKSHPKPTLHRHTARNSWASPPQRSSRRMDKQHRIRRHRLRTHGWRIESQNPRCHPAYAPRNNRTHNQPWSRAWVRKHVGLLLTRHLRTTLHRSRLIRRTSHNDRLKMARRSLRKVRQRGQQLELLTQLNNTTHPIPFVPYNRSATRWFLMWIFPS